MAAVDASADGLTVRLEEYEADLLRGLMEEMRVLLTADIPRSDPVIARLYPDAYDEPALQSAYRELVGGDLTGEKIDALTAIQLAVGTDGPVHTDLKPQDVDPWLTLLTDMRLAIGTRLGVTQEDMDAEMDPRDPDAAAYAALHWLGWIQGSILDALAPQDQTEVSE